MKRPLYSACKNCKIKNCREKEFCEMGIKLPLSVRSESTFARHLFAVTIAFMVALIIASFRHIFLMGSKPPSGGNGSREPGGKENARARSHTRLIVGTRRDSNNDKLGYLPRTASTTLRITSCSCSNFTSLLAPSGSPIRCISYRWLA